MTGFREAPRLDHWVNCGVYVLGEEALERFPERGDHETTTFPELAAEGRLRALPARGHLADRQHAEGPAAWPRSTSPTTRSGPSSRMVVGSRGSWPSTIT